MFKINKYDVERAVRDGIREADKGPIFEPSHLLYFLYSFPSIGVAIIAISYQSWIVYVIGIVAIWIAYMHTKPIVHTLFASLIGAYVTHIFLDFINEGTMSYWDTVPAQLIMFVLFFLNGLYMRWKNKK